MSQYHLKAALGADRPADLDDVWVMKRNLQLNGYYELPDYGLTPYPDRQLFEAIQKYQKQHGLTVDGLMNPGGETEAHMQDNLPEKSPSFRCIECGAWHGGLRGKYCNDCWTKLSG
jgi:hypothetical protein